MFNAKDLEKSTIAIASGAAIGANLSTTVGGMGLIGSFGGMSLGMGIMTGAGAMVGAATFGGLEALKTGDATALGAIGIGALGGVSVSATIGGMGLSVGGAAMGIGMGTMAVVGGVFGLGIYGLHKAIVGSDRSYNFYENWLALEVICREHEDEQRWRSLEVERELEILKQTINTRDTYLKILYQVEPVLSERRWEQRMVDLEEQEELEALKQQIEDLGDS
ncbi:hypothetical protein [Oscillatoria sp. FACHB-1406]|uniref:hypothetical protein n=1 Tax=Oscillatoria sp. FACHB-1406 TaxID=2692846 RepID=UPI0016856DF9|nr:hypothetical protein [Oscillatoria sp. FACHB-1406]MBD2577958.1 hypothetical protein [Oscillatoria sp. FACHB-1406]